jgi:hypothetical protein
VPVDGDSIGLAGSLSVNAPIVSFAANPQNLVGVTIGVSGTLQLTSGGSDLVEVDVTLSTSQQVGLFADISPSSLALGVDLSSASVTAVSAAVTFGPPLTAQYTAALQSGPVLSALSAALRAIPKAALTFTVPGVSGTLNYTFSGVTVGVLVSDVVLVPLDGDVGSYRGGVGCLNIALDVAPFTTGNASQLVNLITTDGPTCARYEYEYDRVTFTGDGYSSHNAGGANLAAVVNADFFTSLVNGTIAPKISGLTVEGVTINSASVSFSSVTAALDTELPTQHYTCISASIDASYSGVGFTFSASFTPVAVEVLQPYSLSYSMRLVNYDASSPFLTVLSILMPVAFPWPGVILALILDSTFDSIVANSAHEAPGLEITGTGSLPLPGLRGWSFSYVVDDMAVSASEVSGYMTMKVVGPAATAPPPPVFSLIGTQHALKDPSPVLVTLLVTRASLMDPLLGLRIAWTAVRTDTGATVLSKDTALTSASLAIAIDRWTGDLIYNDTWAVTCEVYRPADALTGRYSYFKLTIPAGVTDLVDRHYPYVRWDHTAWFHDPSGPGTLKQHGFWTRARKSRIHRTDLLTRCSALTAAFSSGYAQETGHGLVEPKLNVPTPQYLNSIASNGSIADVESWRHGVLCDYCFFGGPTSTNWQAPTPPTPDFV